MPCFLEGDPRVLFALGRRSGIVQNGVWAVAQSLRPRSSWPRAFFPPNLAKTGISDSESEPGDIDKSWCNGGTLCQGSKGAQRSKGAKCDSEAEAGFFGATLFSGVGLLIGRHGSSLSFSK
jgi:hypothetical protein